MNAHPRTFEDREGVLEQVPLLIGLMGPSGSGKSYSALRLAKGIQEIAGGEVYVIDTEARRALHYADRFKFRHIQFDAPFGSLDYLAALRHCVSRGAGVVVVDSMSHEHEGPGGLLDLHDQELERLAGNDYGKRERVKMLAWQKPKAARRALINGILQLNANFIFCFRAKETAKPVKTGGKTEVVPQGFMPIAGDEFVFEMTTNCLLLPHSKGVPTWVSDNMGERLMIKAAEQFKQIFADGRPLDEEIGRRLAEWAKGGAPQVARPRDTILGAARLAATRGIEALQAHWKALSKEDRTQVKPILDELKIVAQRADEHDVGDDPFAEKPPSENGEAGQSPITAASPEGAGPSTADQPAPTLPLEDQSQDADTGPAGWTPAEAIHHGREMADRGAARKAAVPPELRGPEHAARAADVLKGYDDRKAELAAEPA